MGFHNRSRYSQAHARAMRLRGHERLEDLVSVRGQANASIAHRDQYFTVGVTRRNGQLAARVLHRVNGVQHQVHEDLLQLNTICRDVGNIDAELVADRNR
jgi:hypothetical protein